MISKNEFLTIKNLIFYIKISFDSRKSILIEKKQWIHSHFAFHRELVNRCLQYKQVNMYTLKMQIVSKFRKIMTNIKFSFWDSIIRWTIFYLVECQHHHLLPGSLSLDSMHWTSGRLALGHQHTEHGPIFCFPDPLSHLLWQWGLPWYLDENKFANCSLYKRLGRCQRFFMTI